MRFTDGLRDTRGSATAEGVIIAPFLILVFAIAIWAYTRYAAGIENVDAVREPFWPEAVAGCVGGSRDEAILGEAHLFEARTHVVVPQLSPYYDEVRHHDVTGADSQRVTKPVLLGGGDLELGYAARTSCNPVPVDYDPDLHRVSRLTFCRAVPYCDEWCNCGTAAGAP